MIHRFAQILVFATLLLLFAGGLVTSTDSGLAVPDWPLSYGSLFPPMIGGIRYEHTHRLIAATVGLLTLILTIWIGKTESRRLLRGLAIAAFGVVVLQGILGGLTVLFRLPVVISVAHACLGPIFFSLVVSLAVLTSPPSVIARERSDRSNLGTEIASPRYAGLAMTEAKHFQCLSLVTTLSVFFQILLGAVVRHTGGWIWLHVFWAFVVFFLVGLLVTKALSYFSEKNEILRPALFLGFLVTTEFFLGIASLALTRVGGTPPGLAQVVFPTLHQALGSLILAISVVLRLRLPLTHESSLEQSAAFRQRAQ